MTKPQGMYVLLTLTFVVSSGCGGDSSAPEPPATELSSDPADGPKLYVFDCGSVDFADLTQFSLAMDEVSISQIAVPCFLVEHQQGTLVWDLGLTDALYPDGETFTEGPLEGTVITVSKTLRSQLGELGYQPADIDYFAMSHMHLDHAGNANLFVDSTWLARPAERDYAFSNPQIFGWQPDLYESLRDVEPVLIEGDHDVFGDGTVIIKSAPGHTPGHQVLFVDLLETGPVVLSGDLYHFPESRELRRVPVFNFDEQQSLAAMDTVEAFLAESGAELWIEHDFAHNATLRKSPDYYQ